MPGGVPWASALDLEHVVWRPGDLEGRYTLPPIMETDGNRGSES